NSITIIGRRSDIAQIQELVARLDEYTKDSSLQVRLRPIDRVPVEQMVGMLQNIFPQISTSRLRMVDKIQPLPAAPKPGITNSAPTSPPADVQKKPEVAEVVVAIDKIANSLILSGPTQDLDQIDRL